MSLYLETMDEAASLKETSSQVNRLTGPLYCSDEQADTYKSSQSTCGFVRQQMIE